MYATTTAGDDAKLGKYLHEELFGNPVEWPSVDTIKDKSSQAPDLSQEMMQIVPFDDDDDAEENLDREHGKEQDWRGVVRE